MIFLIRKSCLICFLCLIISTAGTSTVSAAKQYVYDDSGQVIQVVYDATWQEEYTYDLAGNRISKTLSLSSETNSSPYQPTNIYPTDTEADIDTQSILLQWYGGDPDTADIVTYDLYVGTDFSSLPLLAADIEDTEFELQAYSSNTTYYWQVVAHDNHHNEVTSFIWSFTTGTNPYQTNASYPTTSLVVEEDAILLQWANEAPLSDGIILTYYIYVGNSSDLQLVGTTDQMSYSVSGLEYETDYYWQIIAEDQYGQQYIGPIDTFSRSPRPRNIHYLGTTISEDTNIGGSGEIYILGTTLTVETGATLSINPGTVLKFDSSSSLVISGAIEAIGTENEPIIFTSLLDDVHGGDTNDDGNSTSPSPADWGQVRFTSATETASEFNNCNFFYGGGGYAEGQGVICVYNSIPVLIQNSLLENYYGYAIMSEYATTAPVLINSTIHGLTPLYIPVTAIGDSLGSGDNVFDDNAALSIHLYSGHQITTDTFWPGVNGTYFFEDMGNDIEVTGTDGDDGVTTLTIGEGANFVFPMEKGLTVGLNTNPGRLLAQGTIDQPISFKALSGPTAPWKGLYFSYSPGITSQLTNCSIQNASGFDGTGSLTIYDSEVIIESSEFIDNTSQSDIYLNRGVLSVHETSFYTTSPITVELHAVDTLFVTAHNSFIENSKIDVSLLDSSSLTADSTWRNQSIPYRITDSWSDITIQSTWTIEPGVEVEFDQYGFLVLGDGQIIAHGEKYDPIVFTSNNATPGIGDWKGISFGGSSAITSTFSYCTFEYAGLELAGAINLLSGNVSVSYSQFSENDHGIYQEGGSLEVYDSFFEQNDIGVYIEEFYTGTSIINYTSFINNVSYGVQNTSQTMINAQYNFWGDDSGPKDTSPVGLYNPDGLGDTVSDYVDYSFYSNLDSDGDGLSDREEINIYGTDPFVADTDGDGMSDGEELLYWGAQWNADFDRDGLINLLDIDSDNDGVSDGDEVDQGTNPLSKGTEILIPLYYMLLLTEEE